tara:strand:+ start:267 stop:404 length:138 start_codon:yes stop_codon:yes gene_type:complete
MDPEKQFCVSCKRTIHEITSWVYLDNVEKEKIIEIIKNRSLSNKN